MFFHCSGVFFRKRDVFFVEPSSKDRIVLPWILVGKVWIRFGIVSRWCSVYIIFVGPQNIIDPYCSWKNMGSSTVPESGECKIYLVPTSSRYQLGRFLSTLHFVVYPEVSLGPLGCSHSTETIWCRCLCGRDGDHYLCTSSAKYGGDQVEPFFSGWRWSGSTPWMDWWFWGSNFPYPQNKMFFIEFRWGMIRDQNMKQNPGWFWRLKENAKLAWQECIILYMLTWRQLGVCI